MQCQLRMNLHPGALVAELCQQAMVEVDMIDAHMQKHMVVPCNYYSPDSLYSISTLFVSFT